MLPVKFMKLQSENFKELMFLKGEIQMLVSLPDGDQARHRVLLLLLHSQHMEYPTGLRDCSTEKNKNCSHKERE